MSDEPQTDGGVAEVAETPGEDPHDELDGLEFAGEAPPEGAIAVKEDFRHKRGADGEVLPVWESIPGTDKQILVRPITQGAAHEVLNEENPDPSGLTDRDQMNIINTFILKPKFDLKKPSDIDDFGAFGLDPLVMTVYNASGWNYARGMIQENAGLMALMEGNSETGN